MKKGSKVITKSCAIVYPDKHKAQFKLDGVLMNSKAIGSIISTDKAQGKAYVKLETGYAWFYFSELREIHPAIKAMDELYTAHGNLRKQLSDPSVD